ncbi:Phosphate transport system permease protein PstA (TC 3.A.1.7.1) [hydrothermal vent metagenome]|uniref:Phosphate transport system permease protein PstA (TC 3.A.1.7.1) n=1 Tax=hydrothermal vent metagenome TaxID=652676 RepID=A0A3B1DHJ9_9ZZZZ
MKTGWRKKRETYFLWTCRSVTFLAIFILGVLLFHILSEGLAWLNVEFLTRFPSRFPAKAGLKSALFGSLWLIAMTALIAVPMGIATAFYLEEYASGNKLIRFFQINIANLAGMPSIVYGLLGLTIFVRYFGLDRSLWSGSLTLSLLILPVIIIAAKEAIRAVPDTVRLGAYALGARRWQVILGQLLPASLPGIMTGVILALSRAIGESAPLIMVGAFSYIAFIPEGPSDPFTALPIQIFNWAGRPQADFHGIAAAGIIVLLGVLFIMNFGAVMIRQKFQRYKM